ncbi:hypothetical protein BDZ97DRAFT_1841700 [Flammula alnicola]|nr:hypothetical protein BDZ97DRAFT_1841700 [Flammula alnicola]
MCQLSFTLLYPQTHPASCSDLASVKSCTARSESFAMLPPGKQLAMKAEILETSIQPEEIGDITGNAPEYLKKAAVKWYKILGAFASTGYGHAIRRRIQVKEKICAKMVSELEILPDMCNAQGVLDQGCMTFLMDEGSAISLLLMKITEGGDEVIGVSQTFNMFFYQPVPGAGSKIRIVNRSVETDKDAGCCRSEIWDIARHRIIVSGAQVQMMASSPPSK